MAAFNWRDVQKIEQFIYLHNTNKHVEHNKKYNDNKVYVSQVMLGEEFKSKTQDLLPLFRVSRDNSSTLIQSALFLPTVISPCQRPNFLLSEKTYTYKELKELKETDHRIVFNPNHTVLFNAPTLAGYPWPERAKAKRPVWLC